MRDITITSVEQINVYRPNGDPWFSLDEVQNASIAQAHDTTDITGKGGRKLATLRRNKRLTITGAHGLVSSGLLEAQTGGEFDDQVTTTHTINWVEEVSVSTNGAARITYEPYGTEGAEIDAVYLRNSDGTLGDKFTQAGSLGTGKFTYTKDTSGATPTYNLAFYSSGSPAVYEVKSGDTIVVFYKRQVTNSHLLKVTDKTKTQRCKIELDALGEDLCENIYRIRITVPVAEFSADFTFDIGDQQNVHNFEANTIAGDCGYSRSELWSYLVFGESAS